MKSSPRRQPHKPKSETLLDAYLKQFRQEQRELAQQHFHAVTEAASLAEGGCSGLGAQPRWADTPRQSVTLEDGTRVAKQSLANSIETFKAMEAMRSTMSQIHAVLPFVTNAMGMLTSPSAVVQPSPLSSLRGLLEQLFTQSTEAVDIVRSNCVNMSLVLNSAVRAPEAQGTLHDIILLMKAESIQRLETYKNSLQRTEEEMEKLTGSLPTPLTPDNVAAIPLQSPAKILTWQQSVLPSELCSDAPPLIRKLPAPPLVRPNGSADTKRAREMALQRIAENTKLLCGELQWSKPAALNTVTSTPAQDSPRGSAPQQSSRPASGSTATRQLLYSPRQRPSQDAALGTLGSVQGKKVAL